MNLTHDDVQEILQLLDASSFNELQLATDRFKLTLRRSSSSAEGWTQELQTSAAQRTSSASAPKPPLTSRPATGAPAAPGGSGSDATRVANAQARSTQSHSGANAVGIVDVLPPIIGTFYRAPKPGAPPFVDVGTRVEPESVIGIIETMKLMNSVYAGFTGVVVEICATNGQLVEQDDVLIRLRAS